MPCPYCLHGETKVVDKRDADNGFLTRRRRECTKCEKRFTTHERVVSDLKVIKKDGRRELFDREKVRVGIVKACEKRPVSMEDVDQLINRAEVILKSKQGTEVPSGMIGELVSRELKRLDKVAYIRFSSVYKDFEDVETFAAEIKKLLGTRSMQVIKAKR